MRSVPFARSLVLGLVALAAGAGCDAEPTASPAPDAAGEVSGDDAATTDADPADARGPDAATGDAVTGDAATDDAASGDLGSEPEPPLPEALDQLFVQDRVIEVSLTFAEGDWAAMLVDWQTLFDKVVYPAALTWDDLQRDPIGVRLKGFSSLVVPPAGDGPAPPGAKYPLKLHFDAYSGLRLHGAEEVGLSNAVNDPSFMRERLAARVYQGMGVPAPRTAYVRLRVDGRDHGLYTLVQPIDKRFLKERFGTQGGADDGNLYKCVYNFNGTCLLHWKGDTKADYLHDAQDGGCGQGFDQCGLVLKTNEDDPARSDYADLVAFLDVLNHAPDDGFGPALEAVFDVDAFLRLTAVTVALGNYDSYFGKGNNFYLYRRPDTGRFTMLPWDLDRAYEAGSCDDPTDPVCGAGANYPLVGRILAVPAYRERYLAYLRHVAEAWLAEPVHATWVAELDALARPVLTVDPNASLPDYLAATHPTQPGFGNLLDLVRTRRAWILSGTAPK